MIRQLNEILNYEITRNNVILNMRIIRKFDKESIYKYDVEYFKNGWCPLDSFITKQDAKNYVNSKGWEIL